MKVGASSRFLKKAKRLSKPEQDELDKRIAWFQKDHKDQRLKTHALTGNLKGNFSFSITRGKRIVFIVIDKNKALFVDIGPHEDVYR